MSFNSSRFPFIDPSRIPPNKLKETPLKMIDRIQENKPAAKSTPTSPPAPRQQPQQKQEEPAEPKYILTNDVITVDGRKLHRIQAIRDIPEIGVYDGDLGGYIERESNLSHKGTCWLFDNSKAYENARVAEGATLRNEAKAHGHSVVAGCATMYDKSEIFEHAQLYEYGRMAGEAKAKWNAKIHGESLVTDYAIAYENTDIYDYAVLSGTVRAFGHSVFRGEFSCSYGNYGSGFMGKELEKIEDTIDDDFDCH